MSCLLKKPILLGILTAFLLQWGVMGARHSGAVSLDADFLHRIWQFEDGLPQNSVQAVTQTRDGYLWVATQKGLARFDGVDFLKFSPLTTPEVKSWNFTTLLQAKDGSLWIGTEGGGVNRLIDGKFVHYSTTNGLVGNVIRAFCELKDGRMLVATTLGISAFQDGKFSDFKHPQWPANFSVRTLLEDRKGRLWVGGGVGLHCLENGKLTTYALENTKPNLYPNTIRALHEDREGRLWVGSSYGIVVRRDGKIEAEYLKTDGLPDHIVTTIFQDSSENIWIGTYGGLCRFSNGKFSTILSADGLPFDQIFSVSEDQEGDVWLGSKEGLSQMRKRLFKAITLQQGLSHNNVMSLLQTKDDSIWVATWGGGVDRIKNGNIFPTINRRALSAEWKTLLSANERVLSLAESRDGGIWFGWDFDGGVGRWQGGELKVFGTGEGITEPAVRGLHEDQKGDLWIATRNFPFRIRSNVVERLSIKMGWTGENIRAMAEEKNGTMWFSTTGGLTSLQDGKYRTYTTRDGVPTNAIVVVRLDEEEKLWFGTQGAGLYRLKDGQILRYTTAEGLFNDDVFEILDDGLGYLWMTCRFGVYRVKKSDFDALDRGEIKQVTSVSYGKHDGMTSLECNAVGRPAGIKTRDGQLWFATTKGIAIVDPKTSIRTNETLSPVVIHQVVVDKKTVFEFKGGSTKNEKASQSLKVPPGRGELEIHYSVLSFVFPEKNEYKYKLEGFDEDWVSAGTRRGAYYSRLKPGSYRFRVIGCNNDGIWNEKGADLNIEFQPHFYETAWFSALCSLLAGGTFIGIYLWNVRKLRFRQKELERVVDERTKHLTAEIAERRRVQAEMVDVNRQLVDASRKAGMAEVASGVLHNIGNVLNSVNVSASLVIENLRKSKHPALKKVSVMLRDNSSDLAGFFSKDPRGKQLPDYLSQLSDHLQEKENATEAELESLRRNVDHIKDIVAMQQQFAKASGVIESLQMSELIEDALQLAEAGWARNDVRIRREFADDPVVVTDKHKVLQILVNLIRNAKLACDESGKASKDVVLRTQVSGSNIQIIVQDNGVGIPTANLTKIFSHGFTTRKDGHGFGLHSSALAAKDLDGSLTVRSDGVGTGATFILEIPLKNKAGGPMSFPNGMATVSTEKVIHN